MFSNQTFSLSGVGYLHTVYQKNGEMYVKINVIHKFNCGSHHSDDVWMDCRVEDAMLANFMQIVDRHLNLQKTVILHFDVDYVGFEYCQGSWDSDDPNFMIFINGKLRQIKECFVNGIKFNQTFALPLLKKA